MTDEAGVSLEEQCEHMCKMIEMYQSQGWHAKDSQAILASLQRLARAVAIAREQHTEMLKGRTVSTYEIVAALKYLHDALLKDQP